MQLCFATTWQDGRTLTIEEREWTVCVAWRWLAMLFTSSCVRSNILAASSVLEPCTLRCLCCPAKVLPCWSMSCVQPFPATFLRFTPCGFQMILQTAQMFPNARTTVLACWRKSWRRTWDALPAQADESCREMNCQFLPLHPGLLGARQHIEVQVYYCILYYVAFKSQTFLEI